MPEEEEEKEEDNFINIVIHKRTKNSYLNSKRIMKTN